MEPIAPAEPSGCLASSNGTPTEWVGPHLMAYNELYINVPPATVFAVLSEPGNYPDWVVGARRIRDSDGHFPAVGSRFHHQVGVPPLVLNDHTEVLENVPA